MSNGARFTGPSWVDMKRSCSSDYLWAELQPSGGGPSLFVKVKNLGGFSGGSSCLLKAAKRDGQDIELLMRCPRSSDMSATYTQIP